MAVFSVKQKLPPRDIFVTRLKPSARTVLVGLAVLTFVISLFGLPSSTLVETWFARGLFPKISELAALPVDAVPFSWLDVLIVVILLLIVNAAVRRRWRPLVYCVAAGYLLFFWSWGLNYHRVSLRSKIRLDSDAMSPAAMEKFAHRAAAEINAVHYENMQTLYQETVVRQEAVERVRRVVEVLDGTSWRAPSRIKASLLANLWFRAAGVDGLFNPLPHEPVINSRLLDIERPFVISHELAHVRGYPDEGDANFVATLATLLSDNPRFRYSGWMQLWLYLRTPELDDLLDAGPRRDLQRIFDRARRDEIRWVVSFQAAILDWFLKANNVEQGIRSYSQVVLLAAGSQAVWDRFR
jgi:hypothetical protein